MAWSRLRNLLLGLTSALCLAFTAFVGHGLLFRDDFVEVPIGGPFSLTDQHGRTVTDRDLRGQYLLIYFGYTHCPDVCPTKLIEMTDGLEAFEREHPDLAGRVTPIFITVDPPRDTPAALAAYMPHFHERFIALTGDESATADVTAGYKASYRKIPSEDEDAYLLDHTSYVYLMRPDGSYMSHFLAEADADRIRDGLARRIR